jgi:hypothetical protein
MLGERERRMDGRVLKGENLNDGKGLFTGEKKISYLISSQTSRER